MEIKAAQQDDASAFDPGIRRSSRGAAFNKLLVIACSQSYEVHVNGVLVCDAVNTDFLTTPAAFFLSAAASPKSASRAEFERVTIWPADSLPVTASPRRYRNSLGMEFAVVPKGKAWLGGGAGKEGAAEADMKDDFYLDAPRSHPGAMGKRSWASSTPSTFRP